jgi:pyruvate/2-oxoglutarate/acetoin dehydrogenase E1 component
MPSTSYDVRGLLLTSIRDYNSVAFVERKLLYRIKGPGREEEYTIPLGAPEFKRPGRDVIIVASSIVVHRTLQAAEPLAQEGAEVEIVDPSTLKAFDHETITVSVVSTGKVLIAHSACRAVGAGAEIAAPIGGAKRLTI